jgi:hypothetical protein
MRHAVPESEASDLNRLLGAMEVLYMHLKGELASQL